MKYKKLCVTFLCAAILTCFSACGENIRPQPGHPESQETHFTQSDEPSSATESFPSGQSSIVGSWEIHVALPGESNAVIKKVSFSPEGDLREEGTDAETFHYEIDGNTLTCRNPSGTIWTRGTYEIVQDHILNYAIEEWEAPIAPALEEMNITYGQRFSDGKAWVQYLDKSNRAHLACVNSDGTARFALDEGDEPEYVCPFDGGYAIVHKNGNDLVFDEDGNVVYQTKQEENRKERVIGNDGDVFLRIVKVSGFSELSYVFETFKPDGTVLAALDMDNTQFLEDCFDPHHTTYAKNMGNGWFIGVIHGNSGGTTYFTVNPEQGVMEKASALSSMIPDPNGPEIPDKLSGSHIDCEIGPGYIVGSGLYLNSGKKVWESCALIYVDGNEGIMLTEDLGKDPVLHGYGSTDTALMEMTGADGKLYVTAYDKSGNRLFEPKRLPAKQRFNNKKCGLTWISPEYMVFWNEAKELIMMDTQGNIVHNISADFPGCSVEIYDETIEYKHYDPRRVPCGVPVSDSPLIDLDTNYFRLKCTKAGSSCIKYYPIPEAAACGEEACPVGYLPG